MQHLIKIVLLLAATTVAIPTNIVQQVIEAAKIDTQGTMIRNFSISQS